MDAEMLLLEKGQALGVQMLAIDFFIFFLIIAVPGRFAPGEAARRQPRAALSAPRLRAGSAASGIPRSAPPNGNEKSS